MRGSGGGGFLVDLRTIAIATAVIVIVIVANRLDGFEVLTGAEARSA